MYTLVNYELLASTSIAVNVESNVFLAGRLGGFAVQAVTTGTAAGTLKLQCSNDAGVIPEAGEHAATGIANWEDVADATEAVNGADVYTLQSTSQFYRWCRVVYVATSGTGNMTLRVSGRTAR